MAEREFPDIIRSARQGLCDLGVCFAQAREDYESGLIGDRLFARRVLSIFAKKSLGTAALAQILLNEIRSQNPQESNRLDQLASIFLDYKEMGPVASGDATRRFLLASGVLEPQIDATQSVANFINSIEEE